MRSLNSFFILFFTAILALTTIQAEARNYSPRNISLVKKPGYAKSPFVNYKQVKQFTPSNAGIAGKYSELLVDASSGKVISQQGAEESRYPASLTKMMTIYLTFEQLRKKQLSMNKMMRVSNHAASMPRTNLALRAGSYISVSDALNGLIIQSANDAAVVLAEQIGGTEYNFAQLMTKRAHDLGMRNTRFMNANGLPNSSQVTTARDMAVLAMALKKHYPEYYPLFNKLSFRYKGRTYISHNNVTKTVRGVDGLKTGFINASGFNLVSSMNTPNGRLVGVVLGGRTAVLRDNRMKQLLKSGQQYLAYNKPLENKPRTIQLAMRRPNISY